MQVIARGLIGTLFFVSCAAVSEEFYYLDLTDSPTQLVIDQKGISAGGILSPAEYCPEESDYFCFSSAGFQFAVPKKITNKQSWAFDGRTYKLKQRDRIPLLGEAIDVAFIEQVGEPEVFRFLFSETRGLLGFSVSGKNHRFFLLENRCGFGAQPSCR